MNTFLSYQTDSTRAELVSGLFGFFPPKVVLGSQSVPMSINDWGIWLRTLTLSVDDDGQQSGDKPCELQRTQSVAHHTHTLFQPVTKFTSQPALQQVMWHDRHSHWPVSSNPVLRTGRKPACLCLLGQGTGWDTITWHRKGLCYSSGEKWVVLC